MKLNKYIAKILGLIFILFVSSILVGGIFNEFPYLGITIGLLIVAFLTNYIVNKFKK